MLWGKRSSLFDRLLIFESEAEKIARWAAASPGIETGGDLFGYYTMEGRPIVLFAAGPGPRAQHMEMNFVQDTEYQQETFRTLARRYRLFYLGDWHSHHTLDLDQPSGSDDLKIADLARKNGWRQLSSIVIQTRVQRSRGQHAYGVVWNTFAHSVTQGRHDRERIEVEVIAGASPIADRTAPPTGVQHEPAVVKHLVRSIESDDARVAVPEIVSIVSRQITERLPSSEIEIGDMTAREAVLLVVDHETQVWLRFSLGDDTHDVAVGIYDPENPRPRPLAIFQKEPDDGEFGNKLADLVQSIYTFAESTHPQERTERRFYAFRTSRAEV